MENYNFREEKLNHTKSTFRVQRLGRRGKNREIINSSRFFILLLTILISFQSTNAATVPVPDTIVLGTDIVDGPTFTVNGDFGPDDTIELTVSGTVELTAGYYMTNAAGVILAPVRLGGNDYETGDVYEHPTGLPNRWGALQIQIQNESEGGPFFPLDATTGYEDPNPPTTLRASRTLNELFGRGLTNGEVVEFKVLDNNADNNGGEFEITTTNTLTLTTTPTIVPISTTTTSSTTTTTCPPERALPPFAVVYYEPRPGIDRVTGESIMYCERHYECLFGIILDKSKLSPLGDRLRKFRDTEIESTTAGSSFMKIFHAWYYTWSPTVANQLIKQPNLIETVRPLTYPLVGILMLSEQAFALFEGELGALAAGAVASLLIGAIYIWPCTLIYRRFRPINITRKLTANSLGTITAITITSILIDHKLLIMVTTSLFVLTHITLSATISAQTIVEMNKRVHTKFNRIRLGIAN